MEIFVIFLLGGAVVILLFRITSIRRSLREITSQLGEKLSGDTNTPISLTSGDRQLRRFAAEINVQLRELRSERLRLQSGDAELKTAITNISHDLRTPLTAISGYLDLLEHEKFSLAAERYLSIIRERVGALNTLMEELLRYSVAVSEELSAPEEVCLNSELEQCLADFYGVFTERGIIPEVNISEEKVTRRADKTALRRALSNILSNGARYSKGDFSVTLTAGGEIIFANRAELTQTQAERLFDRFYTVENAGTSTGLGLSIAKLLVEKMGGSICAEYTNNVLKICIKIPPAEPGVDD